MCVCVCVALCASTFFCWLLTHVVAPFLQAVVRRKDMELRRIRGELDAIVSALAASGHPVSGVSANVAAVPLPVMPDIPSTISDEELAKLVGIPTST